MDQERIPMLEKLIETTKRTHFEQYGVKPKWCVAAPGRVNLIGGHTDYNDGFVFPLAIERYTVICASEAPHRDDAGVFSVNKGFGVSIDIAAPFTLPHKNRWWNYVQGVVAICAEHDVNVNPFEATIQSNVPLSGGLSSSASFEVAGATLIEAMTGQTLDPVRKALICQRAEHLYARVPCGIMDQFISTMGQEGYAMLLDCRTKTPTMIPFDDPAVAVLIVNSGIKHALGSNEYPERRRQCYRAAEMLGLSSLRDATMPILDAAVDSGVFKFEREDELCYRRAKHVITENKRTTDMAEAMKQKDWQACGELMYASHESMRDDFQISCKEIDFLVETAKKTRGVIGSRLTGNGFGGCMVSLVESDQAETIYAVVSEAYTKQTGLKPTCFVTRPARGASNLSASVTEKQKPERTETK